MQLTNLEIPDGWRLSTIGNSCYVENQYREPISARERKKLQGDFPYYGPTGILDYLDHYRVEGTYALIAEDGDHFLKFKDRDMTLLVSGKFNVNNHAHLVRGKSDCTTGWIFNFYRRANLYPFITRQGAGRYKLNRAALNELPLLIPPLPEQRKIAAILGAWDEAIATVERLIAALEQRKQGLMQRLLTGAVRFGEFGGGEWETLKAGEIFHPISKRNNGDEELLSATQEYGVIPRSMLETRVTMPNGKTDSYKLVEPGDFIISLRSFQGGIEYSEYRGIVSPAYTVLKPKLPIVDGFYKHLFKSRDFIGRLAVAVIGIRDGKQISYNDFAAMKLAYPSIAEQARMAEVLRASDAEIDARQQQLTVLKQQKKGLMQRLLTGQVRVNALSPSIES